MRGMERVVGAWAMRRVDVRNCRLVNIVWVYEKRNEDT